MRIVVVGYGPVGARLVEGLLPAVRMGAVQLTVLGAEAEDAYNRVLVAEYAVGRADRDRLIVTDTAAAIGAGVDVRLGEVVAGIDRWQHVVRTRSGARVPYDRLVLATGARANVPTLGGLEAARRGRLDPPGSGATIDEGRRPLPRGVVVLRDLRDAGTVARSVDGRERIVVLGAGVLGMELALAAAEAGARVAVVHHGDVPMARNLDRGGGRTLAVAARRAGVEMVAHSRAESVLLRTDPEDGRSRFAALVCADGKQVDGDLLVLSAGVGARVELAASASLAVSTGILVDERNRSWTDPDVYAIGDCAHVAAPGSAAADGRVAGGPLGLIGPGWRQADALASAFAAEAGTGAPAPVVRPERPVVVMLKAEGVDVVAGGAIDAEPWDDDHAEGCAGSRQVTQWADPARGAYLKLVTRDGVLEGFVAVGLPRTGAELTLLFERGSELPADRSALLRLDADGADAVVATDASSPEATVCWCNGVTVGRIGEAALEGAATVDDVACATRAGTGCGGCRGRIAEVLARARPIAVG